MADLQFPQRIACREKWRGIKDIPSRPEGIRLTKHAKSCSLLYDGSVNCADNKKNHLEKFSWEHTRAKTKSFFFLSLSLLLFPHSLEKSACLPLKTDERKGLDADTRVDTGDRRNCCIKGKGRKHHSHRRVRRWVTGYAFKKCPAAMLESHRADFLNSKNESLQRVSQEIDVL